MGTVPVVRSSPESRDRESAGFSDVVFVGELVGSRYERRSLALTFDVAEVRKGEAAASEAVLTAPGEESCGLGLAEGGTYLVFAQQSSRSEREDLGIRYRANSCGGTRPVVDAPISNALGTPAEPEPLPVTESLGAQPAEDDDSWVAIWALGAVAALVIGAVLVGGLARRRRSSST